MAMVAGLLRGISSYWVDLNRWHCRWLAFLNNLLNPQEHLKERASTLEWLLNWFQVASGPGPASVGVLTQKVLKEERVPGRAQMAFRSHHAARIKTRNKARVKRQGSHASPAKTRQVASAESVQYSDCIEE